MSQQHWWVFVSGKKYGPATPQQLRLLADQGKITAETLVLADGMQTPVAAGRIPGLFNQSIEMQTANAAEQRRLPVKFVISPAMLAAWSLVGILAVSSVTFILWHSHSGHQTKVAAANGRLSEAVASADEWVAGQSLVDGQIVERRLVETIQDVEAKQRTVGEASLVRVRKRMQQLADEARVEREAAAIFEDAKKQFGTDAAKAVELLKKYLDLPQSVAKAEAEKLLTEAEAALSDSQALDTLAAMTDEDFRNFLNSGDIRDGKVRHPLLMSVWAETFQRNLELASVRRQEVRLADEERQKKEKLAREHADWLRIRTPDVRNVCWGDSLKTVKQVEGIDLKQEGNYLSGKVELFEREANLSYNFYDDKLVKITYWISFGEFGNPFELDVALRVNLEEKYGVGKVTTFGISLAGINTRAASRDTAWDLPRQTISLKAATYDGPHGRNLFLTYDAKTAEARAYKEQQDKESEEKLKRDKEELKSKL